MKNPGHIPTPWDSKPVLVYCKDREVETTLGFLASLSTLLQEILLPPSCQCPTPSPCCPVPTLIIPDTVSEDYIDAVLSLQVTVTDGLQGWYYCKIYITDI